MNAPSNTQSVPSESTVASWLRTASETLADGLLPSPRLDAEIILLGTGKLLRFPSPELMQSLMQARKGIEVMDTQAACRTFNVLAGEKRKVAAALLFS